jgi:hypothetical protein
MRPHFALGIYTFTATRGNVNTQNSTNRHERCSDNAPNSTRVPQAKVKFKDVTRCVFLVLPVRLFALFAQSTLVPIPGLGDKAVIRLARLKPTMEIHLVDFVAVKRTKERFFGHSVLEHHNDPVDCEGTPSVAFAFLL